MSLSLPDSVAALGDDPFLPEHALYFVGQAFRQVTDSCMFGLSIFGRKENSASTKVYMLYLNLYEFADATTELVNYLKHQLMIVIVNTVEEILKFIKGQIADDLAKTFVPSGVFASSAQSLCVRKIMLVHLHSNVKSAEFIKLAFSVEKVKVGSLRNGFKCKDL